jgi:hypothetical protein
VLEIQLGESSSQLVIDGSADLGGLVAVSLSNGFLPSIGQAFTIVSANELSGVFDEFIFPSLDHRGWVVAYSHNSVVLTVTLPGDFNVDGVVDAADYVVWRKSDGTLEGYNTWRANFGATGARTTAIAQYDTNTTVPEPATIWMTLAMILWLRRTHGPMSGELIRSAQNEIQRRLRKRPGRWKVAVS